MPGIFISYRREDSSAYAGRLYDHLINHFGKNKVFMDVDSIEPGLDFLQVIQNTVSSCDVLIAVIGRQWLIAADAAGRRLDHPEDLVRIEVATALNRDVRVIPLLVAGAHMPPIQELPEALRPLAYRNAFEIADASFLPSVNRLIEHLDTVFPGEPGASAQNSPPRPIESPLAKIPMWRRWLMLYRPRSFGGIVCRLLAFLTLMITLQATIKTFPEGAYKEGGSWVVLILMTLLSLCFSAGAQWFDVRAVRRNKLPD